MFGAAGLSGPCGKATKSIDYDALARGYCIAERNANTAK